jgi:hypothetical protein
MVNDLLVWFSLSFSLKVLPHLCLQVENSLFLELRVAFSGFKWFYIFLWYTNCICLHCWKWSCSPNYFKINLVGCVFFFQLPFVSWQCFFLSERLLIYASDILFLTLLLWVQHMSRLYVSWYSGSIHNIVSSTFSRKGALSLASTVAFSSGSFLEIMLT